ncbi:MAG: DUF3987 domain-containing protein [Maribacter sp.]
MQDNEKKGRIDLTDLNIDYSRKVNDNPNPFPIDVLPKRISKIILEANDKYQFPMDYLGSGVIAAASTAIGLKYRLAVKDGWEQKINLFTVIVGRPGDSKSHALKFCFNPILERDSAYFKEYAKLIQEYESDKENRGSNEKPVLKKSLISDFTPEALITVHNNNKNGICIYVDELNGWLKNFNRYNNSGEAETYLSLWSGTPISIDRASGKSFRIDNPFVGVIGSTQISVLKQFAMGGRSSNGFMDRLLFVYPHDLKTIKWNIKNVDSNLISSYRSIINRLIHEDYNPEALPIEKEAKEFLFEWQNNRLDDYLFDYERSIEVKLQEYVLRFALILQLLFFATNEADKIQVEMKAVKGALKLFQYFRVNAIKVRAQTTSREYLESLTELQQKIYSELPKNFTTAQGIKIACKLDKEGKPRVSERQFKTYLTDRKLFKKEKRGKYAKTL